MRIRQIGKWGNSWTIKLIPTDLTDLQLEIGDYVDIENIVKVKKPKRRKK